MNKVPTLLTTPTPPNRAFRKLFHELVKGFFFFFFFIFPKICKTGEQGTGKAFVECCVLSGVKVAVDKALDSLRNEVDQGGWQ